MTTFDDPWEADLDMPPWPEAENIEPEPTGFHQTIVRRSGLADLPPVEPLIHGVLSRRSAAVLVGPTGVGKSFVALSWACCVGTGLVWLGREVERAPVLYVLGEGASGLDARVTAWERAWRTPVTDDDVVFSVKPHSLLHPVVWKELGQEAQDLGAGMIILDTFSSLYPDADETKDAATVTRRLSDLAASTDATAVLVHHPGWGDAERTRGGYQLTANVDEVILLRGTPKSELLQLERIKAKDDALGAPINLRRKASNGSCIIEGMTSEQVIAESGINAEDIARSVFGEQGAQFSRAQLRDALMEGLALTSPTAAYRHITALVKAGTIALAGGTKTRPVYELAPTRPDFP